MASRGCRTWWQIADDPVSAGSVLGVVFVGRARSRPRNNAEVMTEAGREAGHDTHRHLTHIARGGALGLFGAGISAAAGFVLVLFVTNLYSAHTAGLFFTATSLFLLLLAVATLGTETGLVRFLLRYEAQGRHGDIPPTLYTAFRTTLGCSWSWPSPYSCSPSRWPT